MKGRFWKKALAACLALMIVSGGVPVQPFSQVFERTAITASADSVTIDNTTTTWTNGTYNVTENVTISDRITVQGNVTLNLGSGTTLTASKGIEVSKGNTLIIEGSGTLRATGQSSPDYTSGIGSTQVGTIIINSGTVIATGGSNAAAIGGSKYNTDGGTITINGGVVNAKGGYYSTGIGGGHSGGWSGSYGVCGTITINGGQVTARGGTNGSGIGAGYNSNVKSGNIILGYTNSSDYIDLGSISNNTNPVSFAEGKNFVINNSTDLVTTDNYTGQRIIPTFLLSVADNIQHGTVSVDKEMVIATDIDKTVTLTVTPDEGYLFGSVTAGNEPVTKVDDTHYTFIMPASDITVSVTFAPDPAHFSQSGDTYTIHDETGWEIFCDCLKDGTKFSGKTVLLDKDITVTEMAGSRENPFKGTFDVGKHTITADISGSTMGVAVFSGINTAIIKDLTLSGSITGGQHCGALVGLADGTNTIENVNVTADVRLDSSISAGQAHHGGVIGHALSSNTTLRGVVYSGTISSTSASNYVYVGGLVGWADDATITIENSLFAGTYNGGTLFHPILCKTGDKTVNGTFTNVYYTTAPTATNTNYYVANAGKTTHTITAGESVTIDYGTATKTYDVSGITAYGTGLAYGGNFYAGEGDEVALTLDNTAPEGYTFKGYSVNAGTLADGTLTMPNGDVTVSVEFEKAQEPVTYIDENGVEQTVADYTVLTGTETTLEAGWYVVNSNISYDHTLNINGNVSLILSDGYTMTVAPTGYGDGICDSKSTCSLDVYGQSSGTGKLSIATKGSYHYDAEQGFIGETSNSIYVDTYTQHSGTVEISTSGKSGNGISVNKPFIKGGILNTNTVNSGIAANEEITITGGKITVGDNEDNGIGCFNFGSIITLGLTNPEDFITASSYFVPEEFVLNGEVLGEASTLKIADGQTLTDGTNAYSGTLSPEQITALSGKALVLANAVNIANGIENGTVTADKAAVAKSAKDDERTVTLTVTPDEGYAVKSVSVNGTAIEPVEDVYSFTMPDEDVTVSAEFIMYTLVPAVEPTYTEAGNSEYYIGSDGKYYVLDGSEYTEIEENSWILPMLEKTEVIINSVDINGNSTSTTVYAETYTSADYTVPSAPYLDGYDFKGWTVNDTLYTTADEVQTAVETLVKSGTAVTVKVDYEKKTETHTVNVVDGTLVDKNQTSDTYEVADIVYVVANEAPEGQRFDHWEKNGAVVGYDTSYSFPMPSEDVTITAVYAADETPVEKKGTAYIESVTKVSGNKLVFVSILSVPENCRIVSAGLVATNDDTIGADICAESVTTNPTKKVFVKQAAGSNRNVKYTWTKSNVSADETWYVKAYLVYIDTNGNTQTVYGDLVTASIN